MIQMPQQHPSTQSDAQANLIAVREARAIYQRVLAGWAMDSLELRRGGLDRPSFRSTGDTLPVTPARRAA
jgi:hypothetical protein